MVLRPDSIQHEGLDKMTCKKIQKKERGEARHKAARKPGHTVSGYTISVILFALAINMIVKSAELECRGPLTKTEVCQPPVRAFMDILTITFTSSSEDVDETAKAWRSASPGQD